MTIPNKNIRNFKVLKKFEAGLVLLGPEVKSIKKRNVELKNAYGAFKYSKSSRWPIPYLINCKIAPYLPAKTAQQDYKPLRSRKLLLNKQEITKLSGQLKNKKLSLIPTKLFLKNNLIKIELALTQNLKKANKRELLKKRDIQRDIKKRFKYNLT